MPDRALRGKPGRIIDHRNDGVFKITRGNHKMKNPAGEGNRGYLTDTFFPANKDASGETISEDGGPIPRFAEFRIELTDTA